MEGIKEVKDVLSFGIGLGNALGVSLEDGKLDFSDVFKVLPALMKANDAMQGLDKVPAELKDLDDAEYKELVEQMKNEFDLPNDDAEMKIELAFEVSLNIAKLAAAFMSKPKPV